MPNATITSTASTFGTISGTFSADQSTITGTISGVITGTLDGSVGVPGPQGEPGVGVPSGGTAGQVLKKSSATDYATEWGTVSGGAWGTITGTLSNQTDLSTALAGKYSTSNPDGYLTQTTGYNYFTNYFYPLTGNPGGYATQAWVIGQNYLTISSLDSYATQSWVTSGFAPITSPGLLGTPTAPTAALGNDSTQIATTAFVQDAIIAGSAHAETLQAEVRNNTGATLAPFTVVYINGALGNKATVAKAQANAESTSAGTFAITESSIADNANGIVISAGVLANVDTSSYTDGDKLYLSPTVAGGVTTTKPSAPNHLVYVGVVTRSHPTLGTVSVRIQNGFELGEIHDVALASVADNDLLAYNSSTGLWNNESFSTLGLLTSATAASTYQTQSRMSSYLTTATAASTYAPIASPALTGNVTITTNSASPALFIEQSGTGNILTLYDQASDTTYVAIDQNGKVNTIPSTTAGAGFNIANGVAPTTFVDGDIWTTSAGIYARIGASTQQLVFLGGANIFTNANLTFGNSTAASTINIGTGATLTATTKAINIGTNGVSGSATNIAIGSTTGTNAITINGPTTLAGTLTASGTSVTLGNSTAASTINLGTGATLTATTKAVNIGTSGVAGSTTNIAIGSTTGTSTTTLQGTTNGITAAADTNSVALATTAYVVGQAGSATPIVDGTAAVGTSLRYARQDHVHPTDTSRAATASPTFTGTPLSTTAAVDTNTTQIATTAYVVGQASATTPAATGTAAVGTSLKYARADHVHANPLPTGGTTGQVLSKVDGTSYNVAWTTVASGGGTWGSITGTLSSQTDLQSALDAKLSTATAASTYAPLASPTFTGTVTIPAGASISGYLTSANAASTYQTLAGMSSYLTTATAATTYAPLASPALTGMPTAPTALTADSSTTIATTAFVKAQGYLTSAPVTSVAGRTGAVTLANTDISGLGTMSTATAADYSTTTVANGLYYPLTGNPSGFLTSASLSGYAPLASPTFTGTVTIPAGASISGYATTASLASYATLASPSLTGVPVSTTAAADTNTTQIATTAFVVGQASSTTPANNGTAAVGTSLKYARADHAHATDTTRAPLASPTFTGTVTIPAGASISGFAPLASPTFSGTPSLPTGTTAVTQTALDSSTKLATTAFVRADNNVKAWVNFNGTGTVAIRASFNVSSITDSAVGTYVVNLTTAISDTSYAVLGTSIDPGVNYGIMSAGVSSTTAVTVATFKTTAPNTAADNAQNYVAVLR